MGTSAFYGNYNLKTVELGKNVTSIGGGAFSCCTSIENIEIESGTIKSGAFSGDYNLKTLKLGNNVSIIESGAFAGCSALESVIMLSGTLQTNVFSGCSNIAEMTFGDNVTTLPNSIVPSYSLRKLIIGNGITEIPYGFLTSRNTNLIELKLGENIERICNDAFRYGGNRHLKEIVLPPKLKEIGDWAFAEFYEVEKVNIPEGVESIGTHAFEEWFKLKKIVLPSTLRELKSDAFIDCESLEEVIILNGLTSIPDNVFRGCGNLKKITIPVSVTTIGYEGFFGNLTDVYYTGTQADWQNINFTNQTTKTYMESATIHYGHVIQ